MTTSPPLPRSRPRRLLRIVALIILAGLASGFTTLGCDTPSVDPPVPTPGIHTGPCSDPTGRSTCADGEVCSAVIVDHAPVPACLPPCGSESNAECASGEVCYTLLVTPGHGTCRPECTGDNDCRSSLHCDAGTCKCTSDAECDQAFGLSPGYSLRCSAEGQCRLACTTSADCGCDASCEAGVCASGCKQDSDCCAGAQCSGGKCVGSDLAGPGQRCFSSDQCASGLLCDSPTGLCLPVPQGAGCSPTSCPAGYACYAWAAQGGGFGRTCRPLCALDGVDTCPVATTCASLPTSPTQGICATSCSASRPCTAGQHCDLATSECRCDGDAGCAESGPNAHCDAATAACVCTPDCTGKQCGDDGCGGTCGSCPSDLACNGTTCTGSCGTATPYVSCGGTSICPPNSTCNGSFCDCNAGLVATNCAGVACGGSCGWEFKCSPCNCPSGQTCDANGQCVAPGSGSGSGGGGGSCPGGCAADQICVNLAGNGICEPTCSGNAQCASGCCAPLQNGPSACLPSNFCGPVSSSTSSGGGGGCHDESSCISGSLTGLNTGGVCPSGLPFTGTFTNSCAAAIDCKICQAGKTNCETWHFNANEVHGGWATFLWCQSDGFSVNAYCVLGTDSSSCGP